MNLKLKKSDFLMAKRLKRRLATRQDKDRVGCMTGLVGIFDFRHGRITKQLLLDHRAHMTESSTGPLYPTSEVNSLTESEEIHKQIESPKNKNNETTETRVKGLMEEDMQCDQTNDLEDIIDQQVPSKKYHDLEDLVNKLLIIHQERNEEEQKPKSLERSNSVDNERNNTISEEPVTRKTRNFFKRRSKSHECISFNDNNTHSPNSNASNMVHHERRVSHFSFTEIKRKLKNVIGKSPQDSGYREKPFVDRNTGWSSPNRDHFHSERFSRISNGFQKQDGISRLSKSERKTNENIEFEDTSDLVADMYIEAKKHLSEMLNNGGKHAELIVNDHSRCLGKLLAFPGYNSLANEPMVNENQLSVKGDNHQEPEVLNEVHEAEDVVEIANPSSPEEINVFDASDLIEENELSCCPITSPSRSSLSVNRKSEEVDSTLDDRSGKPSPVSILEPLFSDDDVSVARTVSRSAESSIQPLCIRFEETVPRTKNQETCSILSSMEKEESIFEYVEAVLLASDLNWDVFEKRWLSSNQILDPSLYNELQIFSSRPVDDQLLLFDTTNEILEEVCNLSLGIFPDSSYKSNIHLLPKGINLINKVWERIELRLNCHYFISLDQLIKKDMEVSRMGMDICSETREIVSEIEELMFEDMIDDTVLSLMHD